MLERVTSEREPGSAAIDVDDFDRDLRGQRRERLAGRMELDLAVTDCRFHLPMGEGTRFGGVTLHRPEAVG